MAIAPATDWRPDDGDDFAAVDLGSNSFHMVVATIDHGELLVVDRIKEMVQLAGGLQDGELDQAVRERALACLERFHQRIKDIPKRQVRAVATHTWRKLKQPQIFLREAEAKLGCDIDVISGHEEGRLVYLGVAQGMAPTGRKRLVIDIGGGSTEFALGRSTDAELIESLGFGCVAITEKFWPDGKLTRRAWRAAANRIGVEIQRLAAPYRKFGIDEVVGSSGTMRAMSTVCQAAGWCEEGRISKPAVKALRNQLLSHGDMQALMLAGLTERRANVFAGGVVIVQAAMKHLKLDQIIVSDTALREGVLADLLGRARHTDPRAATVEAFAAKFGVDMPHAYRVIETAVSLVDQLAAPWQIDAEATQTLRWAAQLHEIGLGVSHHRFQNHGAYLIRHADMNGFSREEQAQIAILIEYHRRKLHAEVANEFDDHERQRTLRLIAILRLAVLLRRARTRLRMKPHATAERNMLTLKLPASWLEDHPLTRTDLEFEQKQLGKVGLDLHVEAADSDR